MAVSFCHQKSVKNIVRYIAVGSGRSLTLYGEEALSPLFHSKEFVKGLSLLNVTFKEVYYTSSL